MVAEITTASDTAATVGTTDDLPSDIGPAYRRIRETQRGLNATLSAALTRKAIEESGKRLGFWKKGKLALDDEQSLAVLMDYAIYDYRPDSKSAVERYAQNYGSELDTDRKFVLDAMMRARFTILDLGTARDTVVREAYDILYDEEFLLADEGLAASAEDGTVVAGRVLPLGSFSMMSGATLLFDPRLARTFLTAMRRGLPEGPPAWLRKLSPASHAKLSARIIECALRDPEEVLAALQEHDDDGVPDSSHR